MQSACLTSVGTWVCAASTFVKLARYHAAAVLVIEHGDSEENPLGICRPSSLTNTSQRQTAETLAQTSWKAMTNNWGWPSGLHIYTVACIHPPTCRHTLTYITYITYIYPHIYTLKRKPTHWKKIFSKLPLNGDTMSKKQSELNDKGPLQKMNRFKYSPVTDRQEERLLHVIYHKGNLSITQRCLRP